MEHRYAEHFSFVRYIEQITQQITQQNIEHNTDNITQINIDFLPLWH